MILFTHPKAPQGPQKFLDAVHLIEREPGNGVYAVAAMEDAMDLLTMIARSNPEVLEAVIGDYREYRDAESVPARILASAALSVAREEERVRAARIAAARAEREAAV